MSDTCAICGTPIDPEARYFTDAGEPRHMLCEQERTPASAIAAYMSKVYDIVLEYGWHATEVFRTEDSPPDYPTFVYSTGFYNHDDHPEMIVFGLPGEWAHNMLWSFYARIKEGERFEDGDLVGDILEGYDVRLRALPPDGRPANTARRFYGRDELPVLQVLWPDAMGRFPGDDGVDLNIERLQDVERVRRYDEEADERDQQQ